jgi:MerR family mercuric resistance operon transcriptional regulator
MKDYSIGELANAAGVPVSTVRFYERHGILKPDARTGGNYRAYGERSLERLRFIRASQSTGFSLSDIKAMLQIAYSDDALCDDVLTLARNRLADVRARIRDLRRIEKTLVKSLHLCCTRERGDLCEEITRLKGKACACSDCSPEKSASKA